MDKQLNNKEHAYGAEQVRVLDDRTAVRTRVAMYLGSSAQGGIDQILYEAIDNSVDEHLAGHGNEIDVFVYKNCAVKVVDRGRGIPAGPHPTEKDSNGNPKDTMTLLVSELHAGGKFGGDDSGYTVSSGLHGVGISCVNFTSDVFEIVSHRDGKQYKQTFSQGIPTSAVEVTEYDTDTNGTGTEVYYHPDKEVFKLTLEPSERVNSRLKELALLNPGLKINYKNEISKIDTSYYYQNGIREYIERMIGEKQKLFDEVLSINDNFESPENGIINVDIAFIYDDENEPCTKLKSFANNINTYEGGYHLNGFRNALKTEINKFIEDKKLAKNPVEIKYILDGLYAVISVKLTNAEFEGQTKTKLGSYICQEAVETVMAKAFKQWSKKNATVIEAIANRSIKVKEAEEAARAARSLKRQSKKATKTVLPGKLSDCSNTNGYREIFLCEGLSAAGSAKEGRYREFQAVLPLRGKILNVLKAAEKKVLESETIQTIIGSFGAGWGDDFESEDCRYDKIIIFTDAD